MKKIMFNDKFLLTQAVIDGSKTMTRRIIKAPRRTIEGKEVCGFAINKTPDGVPYEVWLTGPDEESLCQLLPTYHIGEVVAVAQPYSEIADNKFFVNEVAADEHCVSAMKYDAGWSNKMFVKGYYMPHHIRITDIKVERLQDISDEDCMKEGIDYTPLYGWYVKGIVGEFFTSPREAFAALIDKVSGKGTWESNPWVFAYSFELIK